MQRACCLMQRVRPDQRQAERCDDVIDFMGHIQWLEGRTRPLRPDAGDHATGAPPRVPAPLPLVARCY